MAEPNVDFHADTTESKNYILREFLSQVSNPDGIINSNKFLYLFGEENTGVIPILKEALEQVFGENWESSVYLREDKGQKYPYKLHAHKVEYSRKVIFVSKSADNWQKWKTLYPHSKTFQFLDRYISPEEQRTENLPRAMRNFDIDVLKANLCNTIESYSSQNQLSPSQTVQLKGKILAVLNEMLYT